MILLVCGGRDYDDRGKIYKCLDKVHEKYGVSIMVTGGCRGADNIAADWADSNQVPRCVFPANWDYLGKRAGPARNRLMLMYMKPDGVVAFGGEVGTQNMVDQARGALVKVWEVDRD